MYTPAALPRAAVPVASVPRKLPATTLLEERRRIAIFDERLMIRPRTVLFPALRVMTPLALAPVPAISTLGAPATHPAWVVPSVVTRHVIPGMPDLRTTVKAGPGRAQLMDSAGSVAW